MKKYLLFVVALALLVPGFLFAQSPPEWKDDLVDRMAGNWKIEGELLGREAHHQLEGEWILNHQFFRLHEKTASDAPTGESRYEALWFLGYDAMSDRYVLHLIDIFGGRFSETLGYGTRAGDEIRFVFEYPDGPFHTTFRRLPEKDTWQWLLEQKEKIRTANGEISRTSNSRGRKNRDEGPGIYFHHRGTEAQRRAKSKGKTQIEEVNCESQDLTLRAVYLSLRGEGCEFHSGSNSGLRMPRCRLSVQGVQHQNP